MTIIVYRGGNNLTPKLSDVRTDRLTGLLKPSHGVSVHSDPAKMARFGGAYRVDDVPQGLKIQQTGRDPGHHEIMPAYDMSMDEYLDLLGRIVLVSVNP